MAQKPDNPEIGFGCPNCGDLFSVRWLVVKAKHQAVCKRCHAVITIDEKVITRWGYKIANNIPLE